MTVQKEEDRNGLARIAFVCEGNAETYHAFSGTAKSIVDHLRKRGHVVKTFDVSLPKAARAMTAARTFCINRDRWRARFRYGKTAFEARSARAERAFEPAEEAFDVVFQIGATYRPPGRGKLPYVLYCDWNMALSIENSGNSASSTHGLSTEEAAEINGLHAEVYRGAAAIFTISERLRQSFAPLYGVPEERVVRAYPGANLDPSMILPRVARSADHQPTILFIGREFRRKGGDVLLKAFGKVREALPKSRLLILGTTEIGSTAPAGVEVLGSLRKEVPIERERLARVFQDSDVFCLPSRLDPFPNVVRESMLMSLPCVTTDTWAFPEMVVDGETGFTVPVDDVDALSMALVRLLSDSELGARFGRAGRERAERLFNWTECVRTISERVGQVMAHR